jgi:hypothetical protein
MPQELVIVLTHSLVVYALLLFLTRLLGKKLLSTGRMRKPIIWQEKRSFADVQYYTSAQLHCKARIYYGAQLVFLMLGYAAVTARELISSEIINTGFSKFKRQNRTFLPGQVKLFMVNYVLQQLFKGTDKPLILFRKSDGNPDIGIKSKNIPCPDNYAFFQEILE